MRGAIPLKVFRCPQHDVSIEQCLRNWRYPARGGLLDRGWKVNRGSTEAGSGPGHHCSR